MILGSNANEGASFTTYNPTNPNLTDIDARTNNMFTCPASKASALRASSPNSAPTFRYQYSGNFSNISPLWWMGAYHSSELPMLFGTHGDFRGESTSLEKALSRKMQDLWVAFARYGERGLLNGGWPEYGNQGNILEFGKDGALTKVVESGTVDGGCSV
jgi:carboxylesterase type B